MSRLNLIDTIVDVAKDLEARPSWDEYFMATAFLIATRSACQRLNVGCVIVSKGTHKNRIIAAGYNGFLPGAPHISRVDNDHEQSTVHAEQNAISDAARRGVSLSGSTAYITHFPCIVCAKLLVAAGVNEIKFHFDYNNNPMVEEIFKENEIKCIKL
ncbi:MAG: tRNA-specific adenosine deaminase [Puniceicoccaceae bacterium MED-G32]|jgi:dCMP deaminase|nr:MAG: tRNA-specific adenosine deaminase [Puniceicoccaceae bacterium MED-G32]|tara:strand:- start:493 stop:963 length:471 start_codon:yes stop_codon:yes gene_type:complete